MNTGTNISMEDSFFHKKRTPCFGFRLSAMEGDCGGTVCEIAQVGIYVFDLCGISMTCHNKGKFEGSDPPDSEMGPINQSLLYTLPDALKLRA